MAEHQIPVNGTEQDSLITQGELIVNETRLTRAQVLERYLTPADTFSGRPSKELLIANNGHGEVAYLNPTSSLIMPQIRDLYSGTHIESVGHSICDSKIGQLQNAGVALLSAEAAPQYVADLNNFFGSQIRVEELPWHDKFKGYLVTVFGHNRQLGIAAVNRQQTGHPDHGHQLYARVFRDPAFWEVLQMQAVENTGIAPVMWDRSRAIVQYKALRQRDGLPPTQQEIADVFGITTDQVWRAERYEALPQAIKQLVEEEKLPYSGSFELDRLFPYYDQESVVALAIRLAKKKASSGQIVGEVNKRILVVDLTPEIYLMVEDGQLTLPQAEQLHRLHKFSSLDRINEIARWIQFKKPPIADVRREVDSLVANHQTGNRSLFSDHDAVEPEEKAEVAKQISSDGAAEHIKQQLLGAFAAIKNVQLAYSIGSVPTEAAAQNPAAKALQDQELIALFTKISESDEPLPPWLDHETLEHIDEILQLEAATAQGNKPTKRLQQAAERILQRLSATSTQATLFD